MVGFFMNMMYVHVADCNVVRDVHGVQSADQGWRLQVTARE
jgi:hypothetical protein